MDRLIEAMDLGNYEPLRSRAPLRLPNDDIYDETRAGEPTPDSMRLAEPLDALCPSRCNHRPGSPREAYCRMKKKLDAVPVEIWCCIADRLENRDILHLRVALCRSVTYGIDFAFIQRFFSTRQLKTTADSMNRFKSLLDTRFRDAIKTIEIQSTRWFRLNHNLTDPSEVSEWAPRIGLVFSSYSHIMGAPFFSIFRRMPKLKNIVIHAARPTLPPNVSPVFLHEGFVRQPRQWTGIRADQHLIFSSVFRAIRDLKLKLNSFEIRGFSEEEHSQIFAPTAELLESLLLNAESHVSLHRLCLQYDGYPFEGIIPGCFTRASHGPDEPFLSILNHTINLKHLQISLAGALSRKDRRFAFIVKASRTLLIKLSRQPCFSLKTLELKGVYAATLVTFDQVFRAHARALRRVKFEDIVLRPPNCTQTFFEALADIDLEYFAARQFELPDQRLLRLSDESYKGYESFEWEVQGPDAWLEYDSGDGQGTNVKSCLQDILEFRRWETW